LNNGEYGYTSLFNACRNGNIAVIKYLNRHKKKYKEKRIEIRKNDKTPNL